MEKLNPFLKDIEDFGSVCYKRLHDIKSHNFSSLPSADKYVSESADDTQELIREGISSVAKMYLQLGEMLSEYFSIPLSFSYPPNNHPKLDIFERHLAQYYIGSTGTNRLTICRHPINFCDGDTLDMAEALQLPYPFVDIKRIAMNMGRKGDAGRIFNSLSLVRLTYQFSQDNLEFINAFRKSQGLYLADE